MNQQQLFENIFERHYNEWDNKSFLRNVANEHPYFCMAQYFILKKLDKSNNLYEDAAAKATLFFNNPFLLKAQLNGNLEIFEEVKQEDLIVEEKEMLPVENTTALGNKKEDEETPLFQPLFTSDYFASQGIKLSEKILADDRLGNQLKSFTSWLKTMKKVHPDKLVQVNAALETAMQNLAAKSNREAEVITEAMAEVHIQQDKYAKAIEIYEKLSLTNPSKSAYFADKIYHLKK